MTAAPETFVVVAASRADMENDPNYPVDRIRCGFPDKATAKAHAAMLTEVMGDVDCYWVLSEACAQQIGARVRPSTTAYGT